MATSGRHLDRLTSVDASFLTNESSSSHMHIGAILIFEGPPPRYVDLVEHVRKRLPLVPRFRQKLVVPPLEAGRPLWADDVNFNLTYHIRHTALPDPGGEAQLKRLAGRIFSQHLDRSKPLWELWFAQNLERDPFAAPIKIAARAVDVVRNPEPTARKAVEALEGVGEIISAFADPAPDVPLNDEIGPHRRYVWARSELATFKRIKDTFGGTVNDVVLTVVTGALRNWLHGRSIRTEGLELRALVP